MHIRRLRWSVVLGVLLCACSSDDLPEQPSDDDGPTGAAGNDAQPGQGGKAGSGAAGASTSGSGAAGDGGTAGNAGDAGSAGDDAGNAGDAGSGDSGSGGSAGTGAGAEAGAAGTGSTGGNAGASGGQAGEDGCGCGESGAGGMGGSAGSSGIGGSAGSGGEGGTAGSAGTAGAAGEAGTAGTGGSESCPSSESLCGDTCRALQSDVNNCGACGVVCNTTCRFGSCLDVIGFGEGLSQHICVLLSNHNVRCWGDNRYGQLGHGSTNDIGDDELPSSAPFSYIGAKVTQMAVSASTSCALTDSGNVRCWGDNFSGQLGYMHNQTIGDDEPPSIAGDLQIGEKVTQVVAGEVHQCALLTTGNVRCWGRNESGQLGYGNTITIGDDETPASAGDVSIGGKVVQLTSGNLHTCALLDTGKVRCWGDNELGKLGYGHTFQVSPTSPPSAHGDIELAGKAVQISAGGAFTCALLDTGRLSCWGANGAGQLGYGHTNHIGDDETPADAGYVDIGGKVVQISTGGLHACALLDTGKVNCWGDNLFGKLGRGNNIRIGDDETPASAGPLDMGGAVAHVSCHASSNCALYTNGDIKCWGRNDRGQLGYGHTTFLGENNDPPSTLPSVQYY